MQNYLEKFGSNFLVAAFIPSLAFTLGTLVVFSPIIPTAIVTHVQNILKAETLGETSILLIAFTTVLGFTLSSTGTFIYKLFEGYFFLERFPRLKAHQRRKALHLQRQFRRVNQQFQRLQKQLDRYSFRAKPPSYIKKAYVQLQARRFALADELQSRFPPLNAIMPTRFGNILRSAEAYPSERYRINAVPLWTRLIHVIPSTYYDKIDASNNRLSFLINCSVLSLLFAFLCLIAVLYQAWLLSYVGTGMSPIHFIEVGKEAGPYRESIALYMIGCGGMCAVFWFFYQASLTTVSHYGSMIRGAYDLFRFELLTQLKLTWPPNLIAERELWSKVSDFVLVGDLLGPIGFTYNVPTSANEGYISVDEVPYDDKPSA